MKQLTCEMCGSTDLIKQDGVFVCQSCGCKYSVEEAKKMMIEGTVEVKGTVKVDSSDELQNLLKRAFDFLEDGDWKSANEYCEKVLDIDPENAQAYLGKLMCDCRVKKQEGLKKRRVPFDDNANYRKAIKYADKTLKDILIGYAKSVKPIPDGTTTIEDWAFCRSEELTSITIPNSVTTIGDCAFYECARLTSVTIPDSVTTIGHHAFYGCSKLKSITVSDSVTEIDESTFHNCTALTSVTIPDSVTKIGDCAFAGCTDLESIIIPDSVTIIGKRAFYNCTNLTSVKIGNGVIEIDSDAFSNCKSLTNIEIPSTVTRIASGHFGSSFHKCPFIDDRQRKRVCLYCGGKFKGLFTTKCEKCGRKKDY